MIDERAEWLEADGLGGFASGTVAGPRTRRYHALLLTAAAPPTGRMVLVNGVDVFAETQAGATALSSQRYQPGVLAPDHARTIESFEADPWPAWTYALPDGTRVRHEIVIQHETGVCALVWTLLKGAGPVRLSVRPFLSGRDYHALHHENGAFRFEGERRGAMVTWRPYAGVPPVSACSNGSYTHAPEWYRNFLYSAERERGLDDTEDLASPGTFAFELERDGAEAAMILAAGEALLPSKAASDPAALAAGIRNAERARRAAFASRLHRAADAYVVRRGSGKTIVAGYPWFTDWGRDTFITLRGLCIASGRLADARDILLEWSAAISEGMLPNRFPDDGESPEFNAVDASLWFVIAVHELMERAADDRSIMTAAQRRQLGRAVLAIVDGYDRGTRFGIRADADGLLAAGVPSVQLTWMDARVGERVITPRIGKPVEVQALWINALSIAAELDDAWTPVAARARTAFNGRFWNPERRCLFDVVDVDHVAGRVDATVRPNQIFAVGGLPLQILDGERARTVVDVVERNLVTVTGLRSLAPTEPGYAPRYLGGPAERDAVYHQGTVWPWLIGPFVEAWLRVHGGRPAARAECRRRFIDPFIAALDSQGTGHFCEITDAEPPHVARGCPFQAWSLGEVLRVESGSDLTPW